MSERRARSYRPDRGAYIGNGVIQRGRRRLGPRLMIRLVLDHLPAFAPFALTRKQLRHSQFEARQGVVQLLSLQTNFVDRHAAFVPSRCVTMPVLFR